MYRNTPSWADRMGIQSWRIAFVAVVSFTSLVQAQSSSSTSLTQCVPTPISVAISNVSIANGPPNGIARGIAVSVGTPPQPFAFMPSWFNDSFVYDDTNLCAVPSQTFPQAGCIVVRGGAYDALKSSTQNPGDSDATAVDSAPFPNTSKYSDLFTLNDQVQVSNYTFGVPLDDWGEQFYTPQAMLGFGSNSTFLQSLKAQNMIASRSWSFFWGRDGRGQQSNGSIVFGGYDKNKVQGTTNYTGKLNYTICEWGTAVEISTLGVIFLDASTKNLFNETSDTNVSRPLYGCINPDDIGVASAMPYNNYFANFVIDTQYDSFNKYGFGNGSIRSTGYNFWDVMYLQGDQPFLGDLNITIENGPSVRVSNDQLVVPHVYMDGSSNTWEQDGSTSDLRINPMGEQGDFSPMPLNLGRNFLTFVYMMINLDAGEFTLWPAYGDATTESLVAVDENNNVIQNSAVCKGSAPNTTPHAGSPTNTKSPSGLSGGAIAGIAIGAVVFGVTLLAGAGLFIRHRKRQNNNVGAPPVEPKSQLIFTDKPNELDGYSTENRMGLPHTAKGHVSGASSGLPQAVKLPICYEVEG